MIIIIIWVIVNLALVIPAIFCLLFNLVLEGTDDEEEVGADPLEQPHEGADDVIRRAEDEGEDEVDEVPDEADSSQHDPRFHEADVPLKYKDIFVQTIFDKFLKFYLVLW